MLRKGLFLFWNSETFQHLLDIAENMFSSHVPKSIFKCAALQRLNIFENKIAGNLDIDFPVSMEGLSAYSNNFSGILPIAIANWTSLTILDISKNVFSGHIPKAITKCSMLQVLKVIIKRYTVKVYSSSYSLKSLLFT